MGAYHAVDELVVVVAVDDSGALLGHVLLVHHCYIAEEEVRGVPGEKIDTGIKHKII